MRVVLLGSGSSGNVAYVEGSRDGVTTRVLIDAGLSKKELEARLATVVSGGGRVGLAQIDAVLVTHEHGDHAGCARELGRPLFATGGTQRAAELIESTRVTPGVELTLGAFAVMPVLLPHDAAETVGYVLSDGRSRFGLLTDLGHEDAGVARAFAGCDVLVLETNHDTTMLKHGPYPSSLKRRVSGKRGHLSNDQAATLLRMICQICHDEGHSPPQLVVAAHLSQPNNRPWLAKSALDRVVGRRACRVIVASPRGAPAIEHDGQRVRVQHGATEQLAFDFAPGGKQEERQ